LEGHDNVAALGLAVSLAIEHNGRSPVTRALLSAQRLWSLDLHRQVQESGRGLILLGIDPRASMSAKQRAADEFLMARNYRNSSLKDLSYLYALSTDESERNAFIEVLAGFPASAPYALAEHVGDADFEEYARERATAWAEFAKKENYGLVSAKEEDAAQLVYRDPTPKTPERQQQLDENQDALRDLSVVGWATKSLSEGTIQPVVTIASAISYARYRDTSDLFASVSEAGSGMTQACVASVAAMIFRYGAEPEDVEWAWSVVDRLSNLKDKRADERYGRNPADPRPFYICAINDDLKAASPRKTSMARLFAMAADADSNLSEMAMSALLNGSVMPDHVSWNAGIMASDLFANHVGFGDDKGKTRRKAIKHRQDALKRALARLQKTGAKDDLIEPPQPWVKVSEAEKRRRRRSGSGEDWTYPSFDFNAQGTGPIVRVFPVETWAKNPELRGKIVSYVASLVRWTAERMFPSFMEEGDDHSSRLYEWINDLARLVARVVVLVPLEEATRDFIDPISKHKHRDVLQYIEDLTDSITRRFIYDAAAIPPNAKEVLAALMARMLSEPDFSLTAWRPGEIRDRHLSDMLRSFLLVSVKDAPGAARFANGDWKDLDQMLPQVEQLVQAVGWIDLVMDRFMTLCDRAGAVVPIDLFSRLVAASMDSEGFRLERWNAAGIPAQISGVVQRLADAKHPLSGEDAGSLLVLLDRLVDIGDRRAAALEQSEHFRNIQLPVSPAKVA
jgi:hypothetical protein